MYDVDLFVIGAGSGGVRAARMAAAKGIRVAIAESTYLGGTCVNAGCIPKKLYHFAADYHYQFEDSAGFGWENQPAVFNWSTLVRNKQTEIARLNTIYLKLLENSGATLYRAHATITGAHTVDVEGKSISARHILIATGGWPNIPDVPGRELVISSNDVFDLPEFPNKILVVGGGYIAVELASIFAGLGAQTVLSYRGERLLKEFDPDVGSRLTTALQSHMRLELQSNISAIKKAPDGGLLVESQEGLCETFDQVLYATGRNPNTSGLGLESVKVDLARNGAIIVDENFQTSEPSIFALGDVVGRMALTPVALAEGMMLVDHLYGDGRKKVNYHNIATAVFSHPEVGTVGLTEPQARKQSSSIAIYESQFRHLRHTLSGRQEFTYLKVIVDEATDLVLGLHLLGADAGEIIQGFAVAMQNGLTKAQLDNTIGIHPTVAEEFVTLRTKAR